MTIAIADWRIRARGRASPGLHAGVFLGALFGMGLAVYWPAWEIAPYADDYLVLIAADVGIAGGAYAGEFMFRPLELFVLQLAEALGGGPPLAKAINFTAFLACIALVFVLGRRLAPELPALPYLAALLFACHPVNVATVAQIDTISQEFAVLGVLAAFAWYLFGPASRPALHQGIGAGFLGLAIFGKEVALGAVFALPAALAVVELGRGTALAATIRRCLPVAAAAVVVFVVYMGMRFWAGSVLVADDAYERYAFDSGVLNTLKNVVLMLGGTAWLGSTVDVFLTGEPLPLLVSGLISLAFNGLALVGLLALVAGLRRREVALQALAAPAAVALMLLASLFPVALTGWPSEVHASLPAPFYVLLASWLALRGAAVLAAWWPEARRAAAALGIALLLASSLWMLADVRGKLAHAAEVAGRSEAFLEQLGRWYREGTVPAERAIACVEETTSARPTYSVFAMQSYALLQPLVDWLNHHHRPQLVMPVVPAPEAACGVIIEVDEHHLALRTADAA